MNEIKSLADIIPNERVSQAFDRASATDIVTLEVPTYWDEEGPLEYERVHQVEVISAWTRTRE